MTGSARELSPGETRSLEKIAELRGALGRMRAALVQARNLLLDNEHIQPVSPIERDVVTLLSDALQQECE